MKLTAEQKMDREEWYALLKGNYRKARNEAAARKPEIGERKWSALIKEGSVEYVSPQTLLDLAKDANLKAPRPGVQILSNSEILYNELLRRGAAFIRSFGSKEPWKEANELLEDPDYRPKLEAAGVKYDLAPPEPEKAAPGGKAKPSDLVAATLGWKLFMRGTIAPLREERIREHEQNDTFAKQAPKFEIFPSEWVRIRDANTKAAVFPSTLRSLANDARIAPDDIRYRELMQVGVNYIMANATLGTWKEAQEAVLSEREALEAMGVRIPGAQQGAAEASPRTYVGRSQPNQNSSVRGA